MQGYSKWSARIPRPLLNLSSESFATIIDSAFGKKLNPPFNPNANSVNFLIASYIVPYIGLIGHVGACAKFPKR